MRARAKTSGRSHGTGRRLLAGFRALFAVSALAAVVLGYVGFDTYLNEHHADGAPPLDLAYSVLQLFVLSTPALDRYGSPHPWMLEVARFAAPLVTVHALAEGIRLLLAERLLRLRIGRSIGHAVVCGAGPETEVLAARLRARGTNVVHLPGTTAVPAEAGSDRDAREMVVHGDLRRPGVLRRAGIARAGELYIFGADAAANTAVAQAARRQPGGGPRATYIEVPDPQLCAVLRARRLGSPRAARTIVEFFNLAELGAHTLASRRSETSVSSQVVIAGLSAFGAALLVELARDWRLGLRAQQPLAVTVVDRDARSQVNALVRRYPFLEQTCTIVAHEDDLDSALPGPAAIPQSVEVYICYDDEEHALATMLSGVRLWQLGESVAVRLEHLAAFRSAFDGESPVLDEVAGRLQPFSVIDAGCDPDLIATDLIEQLARARHEHSVSDRRRAGETPETNPRLVRWHALSEHDRQNDRDAVATIGTHLAAIGCAVGPSTDPAYAHHLNEQEVERLAVMEHEQRLRAQWADGGRYALERADARQHDPDLVPWSRSSEDVREEEREAVRALPVILEAVGFQIVRVHAAGDQG